ncbi:MAG: DoxX family membrane protein [Planctomycetota bacterium]
MSRSHRLALAGRILLGLVFAVFGANGFVEVLPEPDGTSASRGFGRALGDTGYMWPLIKGTEVAGGLMLLTGVWVPLGLVVLAPVTVNIVLWNALLDPSGLPVGVAVGVLHLLLAWAYRDAFRGLFRVG